MPDKLCFQFLVTLTYFFTCKIVDYPSKHLLKMAELCAVKAIGKIIFDKLGAAYLYFNS